MARSNGPFGPPGGRAPFWGLPEEDAGLPPSQWPPQAYPNQPQPPQGYHFPPPGADPTYGQPVFASAQWGQQGADPGAYDLANYLPAEPGPFQQHQQHQQHQQQAYETDADYGEEYYEDEEPRSGRRWFFIAAALVGAIGVGGALAYTYKSLVDPGGGRVPVIQAERNIKVKPDDPGGKAFPGSDRTLPNRLVEGGDTSGGEDKSVGPRPVKVIKIGKPPEAEPPSQVAASVPGITLDNVAPPPAAKEPPREVAPPPAEGPPVEAAPPPPPPAEAAEKIEAEPPPPPAAEEPPPPRPERKIAAVPPPRPKAPAPPPPSSSGLGYVVVVASKTDPVEALKAYADAEQRHPDLLSGKTPDVQEANLGDKGIRYRAVVGPPGSREAARVLCTQLKAAGQDCWIKEY